MERTRGEQGAPGGQPLTDEEIALFETLSGRSVGDIPYTAVASRKPDMGDIPAWLTQADEETMSEAMWLRRNAYYDALADEAELEAAREESYRAKFVRNWLKGFAIGRKEGMVKAIRGLMKGMSVSADKAMSMIGIAEADRAAYAELLRT